MRTELRTKRKMQLLGTGSKQETLDKDMDIDALSLTLSCSCLSAAEGEEQQRQQCMKVCTYICMLRCLRKCQQKRREKESSGTAVLQMANCNSYEYLTISLKEVHALLNCQAKNAMKIDLISFNS